MKSGHIRVVHKDPKSPIAQVFLVRDDGTEEDISALVMNVTFKLDAGKMPLLVMEMVPAAVDARAEAVWAFIHPEEEFKLPEGTTVQDC